MVLVDFHRLFRILWYLGLSTIAFSKLLFSRLGKTTGLSPSTVHSLIRLFRLKFPKVKNIPSTPFFLRGSRKGLDLFLFARHYWENRVCFLFRQLLRCFSLLSYLPCFYGLKVWIILSFQIWRSLDLSLFPTPQRFSQVTTSFFVSLHPAILRNPGFFELLIATNLVHGD